MLFGLAFGVCCADLQLLEMGFRPAIEAILRYMPDRRTRQTLLFSAVSFFFFFSLSSSLRSVYSANLSLMLIVLGVEVEVEVGVVASGYGARGVACGF